MRKTKNYRFLNTEIFTLLALAAFFMIIGTISSMWDTARRHSGSEKEFGRKGIWVIFNFVTLGVSLYLLWMQHKNRGKRFVSSSGSTVPKPQDQDSNESIFDAQEIKMEEVEAMDEESVPSTEENT